AFHADAGAHRVDVALVRDHGDLGALARFAHGGFNHHSAVVNFGHLHLEQPFEQFGVGARDLYLWAFRFAADVVDDAADAFALGERFDARLLRFGHHRFDAVAQINDDLAAFESVDKLTQTADVFVVNVVSLGLADFLQDDLLGGLRRNASEVFHRARQFQHIADFRAFADFLISLFDGHLLRRIGDLLDHGLDRIELD